MLMNPIRVPLCLSVVCLLLLTSCSSTPPPVTAFTTALEKTMADITASITTENFK